MNLRTLRLYNRLAGPLAPRQVARLNRRLMTKPRRLPPKDWEAALAAEGQPIQLARGWRGLSWGEEGPYVLCQHGWEGRGTQFEAFVRPLLAAGLRVVALDGPAHGASHGREADPVAFAHCLLDAVAELGQPLAVLGHSMGGAAAAFALTKGLRPAGAVLIAAPASYRCVFDRHARLVDLGGRAEAALREEIARFFAQERGAHLGEIELQERAAHLPEGVEVLVIHDRDDDVIPVRHAEAYRAGWPQARVELTEGLGHLRVMRDPRAVSLAVEFVLGLPTKG